MLRDELDMLECRLIELEDYDVTHVLVESFATHRGVPKPLHYANESGRRFRRWEHRIRTVAVGEAAFRPGAGSWEREHTQRDMAWLVLAPDPGDLVLICDVDEIPSPAVLNWVGEEAAAVRMRACLFAVDWEVPQHALPPQCVIARAGWLGGKSLAAVRDARDSYPVISDGGWHLSWLGGPEAQRQKLETATCHTELFDMPTGALIMDGSCWRDGRTDGGLPVVPVDVDGSWPAYVRKRQCPDNWFRPRESA